MTRSHKQIQRFGMLEQIQKANVEQAAAQLRFDHAALVDALAKLDSLEQYFESGASPGPTAMYSVLLTERSVFAGRLRDAIATQKLICERLQARCDSSQSSLIQAERSREGFKKAQAKVVQRRNVYLDRQLNREIEDNLTARYRPKNQA